MAFIYITEQGALLKKTGERFIVHKEKEKLLDMPAGKVEGILIFGNVQFTTQAVRLMFEHSCFVCQIQPALCCCKDIKRKITLPDPPFFIDK
jgi:CRISPR/Cas system-associated endonuclease Cas1